MLKLDPDPPFLNFKLSNLNIFKMLLMYKIKWFSGWKYVHFVNLPVFKSSIWIP